VLWEIVSAGKVTKFTSAAGGSGSGSRDGGVGGIGGGGSGSGAAASTMTYGNVPYAECKNMKEVRERVRTVIIQKL
jgi:hypothetical protein